MLPQPFDGYPYVVTRIGHTALRSVAVVPIDWSRERLIDLTRRQAIANQLETCLCLGPAESVFVTPDGTATRSDFVPVGMPVVDGLALADSRLSAYQYNEEDGQVWYLAAYAGLSHRCGDEEG